MPVWFGPAIAAGARVAGPPIARAGAAAARGIGRAASTVYKNRKQIKEKLVEEFVHNAEGILQSIQNLTNDTSGRGKLKKGGSSGSGSSVRKTLAGRPGRPQRKKTTKPKSSFVRPNRRTG